MTPIDKKIKRVKLSAEDVEAFSVVYLSSVYDEPKPTAPFHRTSWTLYTSDEVQAAVAAPRNHAKSTALTQAYGLAVALYREQDYIVIVSNTVELAKGHLGDISEIISSNDILRRDFKIQCLEVDNTEDVIVRFTDGHRCRFVAKGSGQKMRGMKWDNKRPGLILCDDLEDDDQTENMDSRREFRKWFIRQLVPCLRRNGKIRMHGTILHDDSLLSRHMKNDSWKTLFFKAHESFDDFSNILWSEQFNEDDLRKIRQSFIDDGDAAGYAQEYLNTPGDNAEGYLLKENFIPMEDLDHKRDKKIYVGADFAVSKKDKANRTSFTVIGQCQNNYRHFIDQYKGRWSTDEWIDLMFDIQALWEPLIFFVEDGVIWKSISPTIYKEMQKRNKWINISAIYPTRDKKTRGRPFQKLMRAGACRFDTQADWYPEFEHELLSFTGNSDAALDDQFDSAAIVIKGSESMAENDEEDFKDEEELEMERNDPKKLIGRNPVTGY